MPKALDPARPARLLARSRDVGALATVRRGKREAGHPYVSRVGVAWDVDASPLFLLSTLAAHTQDLLADPRASLLVEGERETDNPLQAPRVTVMGKLSPSDDPNHLARYLARHPSAERYAGFGDFRVWRMAVTKAQYVAGFGTAKWLGASDFLTPAALDETALRTEAAGLAPKRWTVAGVDSDGADLKGPKNAWKRLDFASFCRDSRGFRARLARLTRN